MELDDIPINTVIYEDCINGMKNHLPNESIHLIVTSPPYFNAREYSQWDTEEAYWDEMKRVFEHCFRVLKNHRALVLNVGDVTCQRGERKYTVRKVPIVAKFTVMLEELGFQYEDNIIWDKGEVESKRGIGSEPYPFYLKPINCHESILIFFKHVLDDKKIPCPLCGETITQVDGQVKEGVRSWECKNSECRRSEHDRGMRFSNRSIMMQAGKTKENKIPKPIRDTWRRDIVQINPVIKINSKGENMEKHSAPFPEAVPKYAILAFSQVGDLVLDPFMGSGTSGKAARTCNRKWVGFEIQEGLQDVIDKKTMRDTKDMQDFFK